MFLFSQFNRKKHISFFASTKNEQRDTIQRLMDACSLRQGYYLLLILAACIITAGLLLKNTAVIIGGMIVAPIMVPMLLISLSVVCLHWRGIWYSVLTLCISIAAALFTSTVIAAVLSQTFADIGKWIPLDVHVGMYTFVAFCSGIAGTLAWVREDLAPSIAGVAVSVSLMPPLCAIGAAFALEQHPTVTNAAILFSSNVAGVIVAGIIVFATLGFATAGKMAERVLEENNE